jgi:hypothetical protein
MPRPLVIDLDDSLPPRARSLSPSDIGQVFGGCVAQGGQCATTSDCCQVFVPPGDYVLCYYYRSVRLNAGYCSRSSVVHGS